MEHGENLHGFFPDPVDNDVRSSRNGNFACPSPHTYASHHGKRCQLMQREFDFLNLTDACGWVVNFDIFAGFRKLAQRWTCPANFHRLRQRANSA